jgi:hypothetical protein
LYPRFGFVIYGVGLALLGPNFTFAIPGMGEGRTMDREEYFNLIFEVGRTTVMVTRVL